MRGDGTRDVEVRHARLDDDALALEVDLEDPVHPRERDDDAACHRRGAAGEAGAGAARDERHALPVTRAKHGLHVLGRAGKDDELGDGAVPGEPVALVDAELLRLGDDVRGAERRPQLGDEGGGQAHAIESRAACRRSARLQPALQARAIVATEVGFSRAADRASGKDRLRRPELLRPRRGAGRGASGGAAPLREVAVVPDRPGRGDRHPADRDQGRLRGRARRRDRLASQGRVEGKRVRGRARIPLRERRERARPAVLGRAVDAREVPRHLLPRWAR